MVRTNLSFQRCKLKVACSLEKARVEKRRRKIAFSIGIPYNESRGECMYPSKIICLTEETVETLYLLGKENLIAGVSEYVKRPANHSHPIVTQFIKCDFDQIDSISPDLVIGFSDLQKEIAKELIGRGHNVWITNQRSLEEILQQILLLSRIVGEERQGEELVLKFRKKIRDIQERSGKFKRKIRVYFEEWDHPRLTTIQWVSELIEICGGENIFSSHSFAKYREVSDEEIIKRNPDIILASWCGKPFKKEKLVKRSGYEKINAIINDQVYELPSEIILQPGPALFLEGIDMMFSYFEKIPNLDV